MLTARGSGDKQLISALRRALQTPAPWQQRSSSVIKMKTRQDSEDSPSAGEQGSSSSRRRAGSQSLTAGSPQGQTASVISSASNSQVSDATRAASYRPNQTNRATTVETPDLMMLDGGRHPWNKRPEGNKHLHPVNGRKTKQQCNKPRTAPLLHCTTESNRPA